MLEIDCPIEHGIIVCTDVRRHMQMNVMQNVYVLGFVLPEEFLTVENLLEFSFFKFFSSRDYVLCSKVAVICLSRGFLYYATSEEKGFRSMT